MAYQNAMLEQLVQRWPRSMGRYTTTPIYHVTEFIMVDVFIVDQKCGYKCAHHLLDFGSVEATPVGKSTNQIGVIKV